MLSNCDAGEDYWESCAQGGNQTSRPKRNQSWIFIGKTDAEAEAPILRPPEVKSQLIGKDPDAGKDRRQEGKRVAEDEMVGWHHWLNGHEFEQTGKYWRTGKPGMLQSTGSQRVRHVWATEQQHCNIVNSLLCLSLKCHLGDQEVCPSIYVLDNAEE